MLAINDLLKWLLSVTNSILFQRIPILVVYTSRSTFVLAIVMNSEEVNFLCDSTETERKLMSVVFGNKPCKFQYGLLNE